MGPISSRWKHTLDRSLVHCWVVKDQGILAISAIAVFAIRMVKSEDIQDSGFSWSKSENVQDKGSYKYAFAALSCPGPIGQETLYVPV